MANDIEVASVSARLGFNVDSAGARRFEQELNKARRGAAKPVEAELGADVDERAFELYAKKLDQAEKRAQRKEAFKAVFGAEFDARSFAAVERELARLEKDRTDREAKESAARRAKAEADLKAVLDGRKKGADEFRKLEEQQTAVAEREAEKRRKAAEKEHQVRVDEANLRAARQRQIRMLEEMRLASDKPIHVKLGAELEDREFDAYERRLREAEALAARKDAYRAKLGVDFDEDEFDRAARELRRLEDAMGGGGFGRGGSKLGASLFFLRGPLETIAAIAAAIAPILLALAAAFTALTASFAAATAGAAALATGLVAAFGPLIPLGVAVVQRLGVIGEAWDAIKNKQEEAAKGSGQVAGAQASAADQVAAANDRLAAATDGVAAAEQRLGDAQQSVDDAQEDLTDARFRARREVEDLRRSVEAAALSERRSTFALEEALTRLRRLEDDPSADSREIEDARIAVAEARRGLQDVRLERKRAMEDAARGTDTVKDAERRLADARQQVKNATVGVEQANRQVAAAQRGIASAGRDSQKALAGTSAAADDARVKLGKLTDTEKQLLGTVRAFATSFTNAFRPATDAIFAGMNKALQNIAPLFGRFRGQFRSLGNEIGDIFSNAAESLAGPEWVGAFDSLLRTARRIMRPLANAFGSLFETVRNIAVAARPYVIEFAEGLERAFGGIADDTSDIKGVRDIIGQLLEHTKEWLKFLGAVGRLLFNVFHSSADDGKSLLKWLTGIVNKWGDWMETTEGQEKMRVFFEDAVEVTQALLWIFGKLVGGAVKVIMAILHIIDTIENFTTSTNILARILRTVFNLLTGNFAGFFEEIGHIFVSIIKFSGKATLAVLDFAGSVAKVSGFLGPFGKAIGLSSGAIEKMKDNVRENLKSFEDMNSVFEATKREGEKFSLKGLRDELDRTADNFRRLKKTANLADVQETVRRNMINIKQSLDENSTAGRIAIANNFHKGAQAIRRQMRRGEIATRDGMRQIRAYVEEELRVYGLSIRQARNITHVRKDGSVTYGDPDRNRGREGGASDAIDYGNQRGGRFERGGWLGGRGMVGPDTIQIAPNTWAAPGEYVAKGPGGGAVINRHQAPIVDMALMLSGGGTLDTLPRDSRALPTIEHAMAGFGGLDTLFALVNTPHMMQSGGKIVAVPGFPGERAARSILDEIAWVTSKFGVGLTDAFGPGHESPGHTVTGTAADFAGPDRNMDRAVKALVRLGYLVGYDGRFGSQAWGGHGPSYVAGDNAHLHVEFGSKTGTMALAPRIPRSRIRGGGAVGRVAQTALDIARGGAQRTLDRGAAASLEMPVSGGGGLGRPQPSVIQGFRAAIRTTKANPVERLALWMAGIVESGLRNLNFGDRDSVGALQQRPSQGWTGLMNPYKAAIEFLRRAQSYRPWRGSAGSLAQAVQRSAFPGRYDQVAAQARRYMQGGGKYAIGSLRAANKDRIAEFDQYMGERGIVASLRTEFEIKDRKYGQSEEELIRDDGTLDEGAVTKRVAELDKLLEIRKQIVEALDEAIKIAKRIIRTYGTILKRLRGSLKHAEGKDRRGIRAQIADYSGRKEEWETEVLPDLKTERRRARLDVGDIVAERAEVLGTKAREAEPPTALDYLDAATAKAALTPEKEDDIAAARNLVSHWEGKLAAALQTPDPRDDTEAAGALAAAREALAALLAPEEQTADMQAMLNRANELLQKKTQDFNALQANFQAFTSTGDLGSALGTSALGSTLVDAAGGVGRALAAGVPAGFVAGMGGGPTVIVNSYSMIPGSYSERLAVADGVVNALGGRPVRPITQATVG